ncbi:MAG: 30S ribosomal protein S8 [Patescibacteria group bacterium]
MDPISDTLSRIRNATAAKHQEIVAPYSNFRFAVVSVLQKEGYLNFCRVIEKESLSKLKTGKKEKRKKIKIGLKYDENGESVIHKITRISKPGQRIYTSIKKLSKVKGGLGIVVVSTSRGIMTDREARKRKLGGEVICEVW